MKVTPLTLKPIKVLEQQKICCPNWAKLTDRCNNQNIEPTAWDDARGPFSLVDCGE